MRKPEMDRSSPRSPVSSASQDWPDPERWSDRTRGDRTVEDALGAVLGRVRGATLPDQAAFLRVPPELAIVPMHRPVRSWRVALVTAGVVVLLASGAVVAARRVWLSPAPPATTVPTVPPVPRTVPSRGAVTADHVAPPAPDPAPAPASAAGRARAAAPRTASHRRQIAVAGATPATATPTETATGSALTDPPRQESPPPTFEDDGEGPVLARAFRALRSQRKPLAALAALDDYQRRFPNGALRAEATLARVEALLALGRAPEALPLLTGASAETAGGPMPREVRLVRAELLARAGRCAEAVPDFDALLAAGGARDTPHERALYGRAACRLRAGDLQGARRDLEGYLAAYPAGALRASVVRSLNSLVAR